MKARTSFSAFLARSFHAKRRGSSSASATFPIPVPRLGLFCAQRAPKLSSRKWSSLCTQRVLHVIIMALNFLHGGMKSVPTSLLGRRPNQTHLAIYERFWALLVACDRPGNVPLPPGRSGFEFIARLIELEHFAEAHSLFCSDPYAGADVRECQGPTPCGTIQKEHLFAPKEEFSAIQPYRSLKTDRLKLSGTGRWDIENYLDDILWLPFVEPGILFHHNQLFWEGPDFSREDREENLALAKLWDSRGLLAVFPEPHPYGLASRVFNAHKNATTDRQIGDRRWMNSAERHPHGPSRFLPAGSNLTSLHCLRGSKLVGCATDRKDFYHQSKVTTERAHTNLLPFSYGVSELEGTSGLKAFREQKAQPFQRESHGDRYGMQPRSILQAKDVSEVWVGFKSLFQGDHLGVEFALSGHAQLLRQGGLLRDASRIQRHHPFPAGPLWEGLVIDDYFAISREPAALPPAEAHSVSQLDMAEEIYDEVGVFGSPDKTVRGSEVFKSIGAEVLSDSRARSAGVITVGAPQEKRLALVTLSLRIAALPVISRALASRLAGNWVSVFMYRRQCSCVLSEIFSFGTRTTSDGNDVLKLPRAVAEELVLASVLGLVALNDVSVPYATKIYATDSSMTKGAFTSKTVPKALSETIWLGGDRKGAYTLLDSPAKQQLRGLGIDTDAHLIAEDFEGPRKCLGFFFDAVEICGGSGILSKALAQKGLVVCTPIDLSSSCHYDLRDLKLINWIFQMIFEGRFKSVIVEPVCTTFSPAQHPASRSYSEPLGFNRNDPKTLLGNVIAFRCLAILWFAWRYEVIALLEQPQLSKMAWLPMWLYLLEIGFKEAILNSCAFGSIHKKPFRLLGHGLDMGALNMPCPGGHQHVRIEGKYTKPSAVYHPKLADFVAEHIYQALGSQKTCDKNEPPEIESVILNDLLQQDNWVVEAEWDWAQPGHINVLESRSLVALFRALLIQGGDQRFSALLDSRVAKGAHGKGRSSARSLRPSLLRGCCYVLAGNLHPAYGFAPTRLNTADAPTRDRALPIPSRSSILDFLSPEQVVSLHARQFSKGVTGWIRLYLLVTFLLCPVDACQASLPAQTVADHWTFILAILIGLTFCHQLGFFKLPIGFSHGFSHASPVSWNFPFVRLRTNKNSPKVRVIPVLVFALCALCGGCAAMPMSPAGTQEFSRAARRAGNQLQADRVVLQQTRNRREVLLELFNQWLSTNMRTTLEALLDSSTFDVEAVSEALVAYGKDMYQAGKSFGRFSETINAVTARRPTLRRQVASAWDLAFNWVVDEPHEHHAALPQSLLLACVGLALLWGWAREAALIAMTWAGVLRVGETLAARREDLVLPSDAAPGVWFAILKIKAPKTRGRAARHQSSRIDPEDIVQLLAAVFERLLPSEMLWPFSPATLRRRFACLLSALGLGPGADGQLPYSLSSLRPGGATYWLLETEDAEYVRRKGRWLSTRVLEIYLQEASVATYDRRMSDVTKSRIASLSKQFPSILKKAIFLKKNNISETLWPHLW